MGTRKNRRGFVRRWIVGIPLDGGRGFFGAGGVFFEEGGGVDAVGEMAAELADEGFDGFEDVDGLGEGVDGCGLPSVANLLLPKNKLLSDGVGRGDAGAGFGAGIDADDAVGEHGFFEFVGSEVVGICCF